MALLRVQRRYRKVGNTYHLKDEHNTAAFEDSGGKIKTRSSDAEIARSMVDLAQAKGWEKLNLSGSDEFRAAAWLYARSKGIPVIGHQPGALDEVRLAELRADVANVVHATLQNGRGAAARPDDFQRPSGPESAQEAGQLGGRGEGLAERALDLMGEVMRRPSERLPHGHTDRQIQAARDHARERWRELRTYIGKIVEHGRANYAFRPDSAPSYFVEIVQQDGRHVTLWGLDLERGLRAIDRRDEDVVMTFKGHASASASRGPARWAVSRLADIDAVERRALFQEAARTAATLQQARAPRQAASIGKSR